MEVILVSRIDQPEALEFTKKIRQNLVDAGCQVNFESTTAKAPWDERKINFWIRI